MTFREPQRSVFSGRGGKNGRLILIRGCPGSGKTTLAKTLWTIYGEQLVRIEADMFFEKDRLGYDFDVEKLGSAHRWCLNTAKIMLNTRRNVAVSNTFTQFKEMADYVNFALNNDFALEVHTLTSEFVNSHNVPEDKLKQMRARFQTHEDVMKRIEELYCAEYLPY